MRTFKEFISEAYQPDTKKHAFDMSYRKHPIFKHFAGHQDFDSPTLHEYQMRKGNPGDYHALHVRQIHMPRTRKVGYEAKIASYNENSHYAKKGFGTAETSHGAVDAAHKAYTANKPPDPLT